MEKKLSDKEKRDRIRESSMIACSVYDCTGLIPSAITDESQAQAYEELYPYRVPTDDNKDNN